MRASQAAALLTAIGLAMAGRTRAGWAQDASPSWNDSRSLALVELATRRRAQQLADTALRDYQADGHGYVTFLAQLGKGFIEIPKVVKVDELAIEVYWHAPNLSKQRIVGRRDTTMLPTDIQYHRDHLGIVQNNFPDIIRLGDGDEVRDVPHPLSPAGLKDYDFAIADSMTIAFPGGTIHALEVKVRPKDDRQARVVGAIFIEPNEGQVVRMAFNFTHAAFLDSQLEDFSVVLDNGLVGTRFWLPHVQEIEIRRTGTYLDFPVRGIIRGRWEIENYHFNLNQPVQTFAGQEFTQAPLNEQKAYKWPSGILDSLPAEVKMATDREVQQVQTEARALVRETALARPERLVISAPGIWQFVQVNRVEGLALGTGLGTRFGGGYSIGGNGRYGLDDHQVKGTVALGWEGPSRSGWRVFGSHDFRDVGDVPERATAVNSIAAQEFGSDDTDPYDVLAAGIGLTWRKSESVVLNFETSFERDRPLGVHARPVTGQFLGTVPADPVEGLRGTARLERASTPWIAGSDLATVVELRGLSGVGESAPMEKGFTSMRLSGNAEVTRPFGSLTARSWTTVGFERGTERHEIPVQDELYFGGPITGAGYRYHEFAGTAGISQRFELQLPVPFPRIPLSRFGSTPGNATLVPFLQMIAGSFACPEGRFAPCGGRGIIGAPSVGLGLMPFYQAIRIVVAHGFRGNVWTFNVDVSREFWRIL